jgi:ABC-2 type transport system permease protein
MSAIDIGAAPRRLGAARRSAIFFRELKAGRRAFLGWLIPTALLIVVTMSAYPAIAEGQLDINALVKSMPAGLKAAFGLGRVDLRDPISYYATRGYQMVALLGAIYAALYAGGITAKEQGERTAEFLLSRPVSRALVLGNKAAAVLFYVVLFHALLGLIGLACLEAFARGRYSAGALAELTLGHAAIGLCFAGLAFLLSAALSKARGALPAALGGVMGGFLLSTLSHLNTGLEWLGWLSPFAYADGIDIALYGLPSRGVLALLSAGFVAAALAFPYYTRKDIPA